MLDPKLNVKLHEEIYGAVTKIIFDRYPRIKGAHCASIAYGIIDFISEREANYGQRAAVAVPEVTTSAFERWATWHGKLPLDISDSLTGMTEDGRWALPTYGDGYTEIAHRAWFAAVKAAPSQPQQEAVPAVPSEQDRIDAERWRAFLGSQRIRPLGSAGLERPEPNNYAHMGFEIWTVYGRDYSPELLEKMDSDNEKGRRWLIKYADVARAAIAMSAAKEPGHE